MTQYLNVRCVGTGGWFVVAVTLEVFVETVFVSSPGGNAVTVYPPVKAAARIRSLCQSR